jgi:hypothetical protein
VEDESLAEDWTAASAETLPSVPAVADVPMADDLLIAAAAAAADCSLMLERWVEVDACGSLPFMSLAWRDFSKPKALPALLASTTNTAGSSPSTAGSVLAVAADAKVPLKRCSCCEPLVRTDQCLPSFSSLLLLLFCETDDLSTTEALPDVL